METTTIKLIPLLTLTHDPDPSTPWSDFFEALIGHPIEAQLNVPIGLSPETFTALKALRSVDGELDWDGAGILKMWIGGMAVGVVNFAPVSVESSDGVDVTVQEKTLARTIDPVRLARAVVLSLDLARVGMDAGPDQAETALKEIARVLAAVSVEGNL